MYDPRWNQEAQCDEVIRNCWSHESSGSNAYRVVSKLKSARHGLVTWNKAAGIERSLPKIRLQWELYQRGGS